MLLKHEASVKERFSSLEELQRHVEEQRVG